MNSPDVENDEIKLLLPWYVNRTLDAAERTLVVEHLVHCGECRNAEAELRRISAAIASEQPTPLVPEAPISDFLDEALELERHPARSHRAQWFAAAASVIALIGVSAWLLGQPPEANVFRTATVSPPGAEISYVFDVVVAADVDELLRQAVAETFVGSTIVESERGYRVSVTMPSATMKELDGLADSLRHIDGVRRVDIVGVQLPFE